MHMARKSRLVMRDFVGQAPAPAESVVVSADKALHDPYPSLRFLAARGNQNQIRDFLRVRHQGHVTRIQVNGRRVHALSEKSFQLRIDGAVLSRYLIPRGLDSFRTGRELLRK
jgi:hypothetical protein